MQIQGFKSFPDKIKLDFNDGITAVVGPNGSGKSNILDAIRWVLGEQSSKSLRGDKMEDVIFKGTDIRKAQGFAAVSLTFDNSKGHFFIDSDEFSVTRKYYRSGESEYSINGDTVRLKDINEVLMGTGIGRDGYSVIGQGKIDEIVLVKPRQRREIFDEAAGITKFRHRKEEALQQLQKAEDNLVRLHDILTVLEQRVGPLKLQSEKAAKYIELAEQCKNLEISLWVLQLDKFVLDIKSKDDNILISENDYKNVSEQIENISAQINEAADLRQKANVEMDDLRRQKATAEEEISNRDKNIAVMENDILRNNQDIERIYSEIDVVKLTGKETDEKILTLKAEIENINIKIEDISTQIAEQEENLSNFNTQNKDFNDNLTKLNKELNDLFLEQSRINSQINAAEQSVEQTTEQLQILNRELSAKTEIYNNAKNELEETETVLQTLTEKGVELQNYKQGYELKLNSKKSKLDEQTAVFNKLEITAREKQQRAKILQNLEDNLEGFYSGVKMVINAAKTFTLRGISGTIAQHINTESKYSVAIETALGGAVQNIITENEEAAKNAIRFLKEKNGGRVTFMPLNAVTPRYLDYKGLEQSEGYVGIAVDLVKYDGKMQNVARNLLGNIVVAEDLDCAVSIAKKYGYKFRVVSLDGQTVNAGGSMTGGSQNKNTGMLSRKSDIEKLNSEVKTLTERAVKAKEQLSATNMEVAEITANITNADSELRVAFEDKIKFEGEQKRLVHIIEQSQTDLSSIQTQKSHHETRIEQTEKALTEYKKQITQCDENIKIKNAELESKTGDQKEFAAKREEITNIIHNLNLTRAEYKKETENNQNSISLLTESKDDSTIKINALNEQIVKIKEDNIKIEQDKSSLSGDNTGENNKIELINSQIDELMKKRDSLESDSLKLRGNEQEWNRQKEENVRELTRLREQKVQVEKDRENLLSKMWDEYKLTKNEAVMAAKPLENPRESERELNSIKSKIKSLGSINVDAIDEYKLVNAEYLHYKQQIEDIEVSKQETNKLINDLNGDMTKMFNKSFTEIKEWFSKLFVELFGGGNAQLLLTEPDNVLESGIEIQAKPPGEKVDTLSLLSGGQKALIAISVYFSLLHVRPSPFCILDEIDAALDDVNVTRYAAFLRKMSGNTQFITITHRHGTMEEADILYGVNMQEKGVSKLLKLHISEINNM